MFLDSMITAHSGSEGTQDNSIEFVNKALQLGVEALEVDVLEDGNQRLILSHNEVSEEIFTHCPTLAEVFLLVRENPRMKINCDLKQPNLEMKVIKLAEEMGLHQRVILSGNVGIHKLSDTPELVSKAQVFLNAENILKDEGINLPSTPFKDQEVFRGFVELAAQNCCKYGVKVININYHMCTDMFFDIMDAYDVWISAWTVNEEKEIGRLLDKGVYNITTRKPSMALCIRKDKLAGSLAF